MGFAGEIKDFLANAKETYKLVSDTDYKDAMTKYTSTQEEKMRKDMEDPLNEEMKRAQLADIKSRTANRGAGIALQRDILNESRLARQQAEGAAAAGISGPTARPSQLPVAPAVPPDDDSKPVPQGYARGGLVKTFQGGGYADEDDDPYDDDDVTPQVTSPAIGGTSDATDFSSQSRAVPAVGGGQPAKGSVPIPVSRAQAMQAITDAQKYGISMMTGNGAVPSQSRQRGLRAYAMGAGAAPSNEMLNIYRKIDPDGTMGESERNMTAIGALYDYKMKAGDPQGAARVAFQALQSYKTAARNYAAIGAAAIQGGQIDDGLKAIMKSYANIPDGKDLKLWQSKDGQINYQVTLPDGTVDSHGIAPPDKILGAAMKVAGGAGFDEHLADMAAGGMPGSRGGAVGGGRKKKAEEPGTGASEPDKPQNYAELESQVGGHVDKWVQGLQSGTSDEKKAAANLKPSDIAMIKNGVFHIRQNSGMTTDESLRTFQDYVNAPATYDKKKGPAFTLVKDDTNNERTLKFPDGRTVVMPTSDYAALAAARGQRLKELEDAKNAPPPPEGYGPKFERATEAARAGAEATFADPAEVKARMQRNLPGPALNISPRAGGPPPAEPAVPTAPYNPRVGQYGGPRPAVGPPQVARTETDEDRYGVP